MSSSGPSELLQHQMDASSARLVLLGGGEVRLEGLLHVLQNPEDLATLRGIGATARHLLLLQEGGGLRGRPPHALQVVILLAS